MTEPAESPASRHMARDIRREIAERVLHGTIPRGVAGWADLRQATRRDLLDDARERAGEEQDHDPTAADDEAAVAAVDAWLRTGAAGVRSTWKGQWPQRSGGSPCRWTVWYGSR